MRAAAADLGETGARCVVVKGGHLSGARTVGLSPREATEAVDVVWHDGAIDTLVAPWVDTPNTHGTGCTFAAAVAALLATGADVATALAGAKAYVSESLGTSASWRLGSGSGPVGWPAQG
jgi:hydroxymethylpyrimidine/phosphomethylpyrimidine kinase